MSEPNSISALHTNIIPLDEWQHIFAEAENDTDEENFIVYKNNIPCGWLKLNGLKSNDKPVARCAVERYSDAAWETADVKTALNHRNKGLSKWCALLRTVFKNQEPRASQRQRKNENIFDVK